MKIISTFVHGILDYLTALLLLAAPHLFAFTDVGNAALAARVVGVLILGQALMTRYEVGALRVLPMKLHLMDDYIVGVLLAASPWLLGFSTAAMNAWLPHVLAGVAILGVSAMTEQEARASR